MVGDPLGGMVMGFVSLVSGIVDLGEKMGMATNSYTSSSYQCEHRFESREEFPVNSFSNKWQYISCSEYQRYLMDVKKRSGSLILIR